MLHSIFYTEHWCVCFRFFKKKSILKIFKKEFLDFFKIKFKREFVRDFFFLEKINFFIKKLFLALK
jgi:hypothetical protein